MPIDMGFRRPGKVPSSQLLDEIKERGVFRQHVRLQQVLASGNSHCCSLLLFYPQGNGARQAQVQRLTEGLTRRIGATDEMGWFDSDRFGVLLPHTHQAGAQHLGEEIRRTFSIRGECIPFEVYVYPGAGQRGDLSSAVQDKLAEPDAGTSNGTDPLLETSNWLRTWPGTTWPEPLDDLDKADEPNRASVRSPMPAWKRAFDIVGSVIGLMLALPIVLVAAVLIKCVSKGPLIYKQQRVGYKGRVFTMWKLRTYQVGTSHDDHKQHLCRLITEREGTSGAPMKKLDGHPGIIRFGNLLRKTCIDELPQFINVLIGDMSLVGPRPALPYEAELYAPWHTARLDSVPGMTGLWQVSGKNRLPFDEMVRLDIRYAKRMSVLMDLWILAKTPLAVVEQMTDSPSENAKVAPVIARVPIVETRSA